MTGTGNWIGAGAAAALVNVSRQALHKRTPYLEQLGVARREGRNWSYAAERLPAAYVGDLGGPEVSGDDPPALLLSRSRREAALAALAELELEERRGELVKVDQVEREAFAIARRVREAMTNIPDRLAAEVAALSKPSDVHALLTREIRAALQGLADGPALDVVG